MQIVLALKILEGLASLVATGAVSVATIGAAFKSVNMEESDTKALLLLLEIQASQKALAQAEANRVI